MYIIIIGGGVTGAALVKHLSSGDHEIVIVEEDEDRAKTLAETMDALVIHGDGSEPEILKDAGIERADTVAILTREDNTNLTICQIVKKFNVKRIVARVNDPSKQDLYIGMGITAISPISVVVSYFKNALTQEKVRSLVSIAKGKAELLEIGISNEKLDGRKIKDISLPHGAIISLISRNGDVIIGSPDEIVRKNDLLTVITLTENAKDVVTMLGG
ncbi:MAG: NAD-binding protein [Candidatus Altiarchaeota archaeon]|nr:NAD-binding protein [Candidatus Altiarchaeota archaeon]